MLCLSILSIYIIFALTNKYEWDILLTIATWKCPCVMYPSKNRKNRYLRYCNKILFIKWKAFYLGVTILGTASVVATKIGMISCRSAVWSS